MKFSPSCPYKPYTSENKAWLQGARWCYNAFNNEDELLLKIKALPRETQIKILFQLNKITGNPEMGNLEQRFNRYRWAIERLTHVNILEDTRKKHVVLARSIVAYTLLKDGFHSEQIGKLIGRDHSTIYNMKKLVQSILAVPKSYADEYLLFQKFNVLLQNNKDDE